MGGFAERRERARLLKNMHERGEIPAHPCYACQHLFEWGKVEASAIKPGKFLGCNGYSEYLLCEDHKEKD